MLPGTALNRCGHLEISEDHEGAMKRWGQRRNGAQEGVAGVLTKEGAGGLAPFLGMPLPSCRTWIRFLLLNLGFPVYKMGIKIVPASQDCCED